MELNAIPETDAVWVDELFALLIVKSLIILFVIVFVPLKQKIPFIKPAIAVLVLVVPLVRFAIMLFWIMAEVVEFEYIP